MPQFPSVVYAHLTAWGRQGPGVDRPGYDTGAFAAASGMMELQVGESSQSHAQCQTHLDGLPIHRSAPATTHRWHAGPWG
jgi:crotonobetainyl-CoA:carnitine CoA-transferase CaiB-like acyl-CoA transferase